MITTLIKHCHRSFVYFLTQNGLSRHLFRRFLLVDIAKRFEKTDLSSEQRNLFFHSAQQTIAEIIHSLESHSDGLTTQNVDERRAKYGLNQVEADQNIGFFSHLWRCYRNPFNLLLTLLAIISYITDDVEGFSVIATMIVLSTLLRFIQEKRSNKAASQLQSMVSNTATVLRRESSESTDKKSETSWNPKKNILRDKQDIPIQDLVPGDLIFLTAGDMIPADLRILYTKDLFVNQASMTGESLPIEKFPHLSPERENQNFLELDNICFMGTNVISGSAIGIVLTTGAQTYFGTLAKRLHSSSVETETRLQKDLNRITWLLIRFMGFVAPFVFFINFLTKGNWLESVFFSLSVAVGLTPEMLPMIATSTLARGAVALSRKKVIVKHLDAIQNFGSMNIFCTDKTGTLTQDKIVLECYTDVFGHSSDLVLEHAYLNSYYQTGLKNLLDVAVLEHAELQRELNLATNFRKVDEIPFDFHRRRMSVVVSEQGDHHLLICKGALEEIIGSCTSVYHNEQVLPLTEDILSLIYPVTQSFNEQGLRVVAVAVKKFPPDRENYSIHDEQEMTLVGYVSFLDPPKESASKAIQVLCEQGVTIKILTGDNELVTQKICEKVGLPVTGIVLGHNLDQMSPEEYQEAVEKNNVFAKLSPTHKEKIIHTLKTSQNTVGYMGDGINDAAALREADVGISVDSAVDIAKEAADIILLEKSLMVLEEGVIQGRETFANMNKYIQMTLSGNFGNVFSILLASLFLPFLPLLPIQILTQNLMYDLSQTAIPFDHVDHDSIRFPLSWNFENLTRIAFFFGPVSSLFDILTFLVMYFVFHANTIKNQSLFQTGWFIEGLLSQILIVHLIRTKKIPFLQSCASWPVVSVSTVMITLGLALTQMKWGSYLKFSPLPWTYYPFLAAIVFSYIGLTHLVKTLYIKKYGLWI